MPRPLCLRHCTSEPYRFFGRQTELRVLEEAFAGGEPSVTAFIGPGGQGKTAIVQHWLEAFRSGQRQADGVFLWSFYRGKDADLCLRELHAYAAGQESISDVSATFCVDYLLPLLRRERWALIFDGAEVVQYDGGDWFGRFVHPELGRLIEELASEPLPGVVVVTSRFPLAGLEHRRHARVFGLAGLDADSARGLLRSLGVHGPDGELDAAAAMCGFHAKAVELLGTYLARFADSAAHQYVTLPAAPPLAGGSDEENRVAHVLAAFQTALPAETQDILALATAFRDPPTEDRLVQYLNSDPVHDLLHVTWARPYVPFRAQPTAWLERQIQQLVELRLLERVGQGQDETRIDAHPLVRRGFEQVLGMSGKRQSAGARAGFLRGRPDRRQPATLEEAREEVEMFHAYCDAGWWNEADSAYVALDNPKHRFLAPAFERDLLVRFFPNGDWRQPPLWPGFGRYRSLAICWEMLGQFEEALAVYRPQDAPLRGDAWIALGRLRPLLDQPQASHPWQTLWGAYRCHALCLAGRLEEGIALAQGLVPVDIYEWVHVFECLLRAGKLAALDLRSVLFRPPHATEHRWSELARSRMQADFRRITQPDQVSDSHSFWASLTDAYDQGGLPFERVLTRLSQARWLLSQSCFQDAAEISAAALTIARRFHMPILAADALRLAADAAWQQGQKEESRALAVEADQLRETIGFHGPWRP
ncbi:MAG: hypothetical protein ACK4RK_07220 [Gemmataceae bacterium]